MKVENGINYYFEYLRANCSSNTFRNFKFTLNKFKLCFQGRELDSIGFDEIMTFLSGICVDMKQSTKFSRRSTLSTFYNFVKDNWDPKLINPCMSPVIKKIYKQPKVLPPVLYDKESINEFIYSEKDNQTRLLFELMGRAAMRVGEVLEVIRADVHGRVIKIRNPKSKREGEVVYLSKKLEERLNEYIRIENIGYEDHIFPYGYSTARRRVKDGASRVGLPRLAPHDLRRHVATMASRSGVPIEIVSRVILRHADLATTERYLGRVREDEAIKWIDNLYS